jgi:peptide/nickel transport system permease protein
MPDLATEIEAVSPTVTAPTAARPARTRLGLAFWLPSAWIAVIAFCAAFASVLPLQNPFKSDYAHVAVGPGTGGHLLGTDEIGRDLLARLVFGARVSLTVGLVAIGVGMIIGGLIGLLAGYYRGRIETALMGVVDVMLAFPALVLVIAITAFLGQSLRNVTVAVAVVAIPAFARVTRAATLTFSTRDFVTAARGMGATDRRVLFREVLPNVALPVVAFALVVVGVAIIAEGGLAFLGLSVPPPHPSWGSMIYGAKNKLADGTAPFISLIPAGVMFLTVLSFNMVGDRLRSRLSVREGSL